MAGRHRRVRLLFAMATFALLTTGCARAVEVGSADPRLNYSIDVRNETTVAMIVSYNDGRGDALLGLVEPGRVERFIIASPATTGITVTGVAESGGRTSGPHAVTLGATRPLVVLR
jgi:hypothetical protein